jgi:CRP/FNR family transcriptional regulator, anaerobic regulatory protein
MITEDHFTRILPALPILRRANPQLVTEFKRAAFLTQIPAGKDVFVEGDDVDAIALLVSGVVRVYKVGETGREITLYRFGLGESCMLTANAILSRQSFSAIATVEQDAEAVMIPANVFRDWVRRYDPWRDFVFTLLSQRLSSVMEIVDEVTFQRMDIRVAALLLERSKRNNPMTVTHQEIASELGSSREVISRILEKVASMGISGCCGVPLKSSMSLCSNAKRLCDLVTDTRAVISYAKVTKSQKQRSVSNEFVHQFLGLFQRAYRSHHRGCRVNHVGAAWIGRRNGHYRGGDRCSTASSWRV